MTTRRRLKVDVLFEDGQHYALSMRSVLQDSAAIHHRISLAGNEYSTIVLATDNVRIVDAGYSDCFLLQVDLAHFEARLQRE